MYLRAAKSDAENAGIEVDGMANSVSELRSELKSLTGVDIMLDSKKFQEYISNHERAVSSMEWSV